MKDLDSYLEEAIDNVRADRDKAKDLLKQLETVVSNDTYSHKQLGVVAAKYLETLQRSNEQLVKIASLKQKTESVDSALSEQERDEIFKELNKK